MAVIVAIGKTICRSRVLAFRPFTMSPRIGTTTHVKFFSSIQEGEQTTRQSGEEDAKIPTPWNDPRVQDRVKTRRKNNNNRFRQHVNPLARPYQQPTKLSSDWPHGVFDCLRNRDLHVDIGCGKGGFLLEYAGSKYAAQESYNYLGLEIRPMVAQYAKERVTVHGLEGKVDFLGCNANVDLDRLLTRYHAAASTMERPLLLTRVSIQYPDPHFKKHHAKRRVVTPDLVDTVAKFMPPSSGVVFLQSDVQPVLDDMRDRFAQADKYFSLDAVLHRDHEHLPHNPLNVPTEREVSVLEKDLPVYRVLFQRTATPYEPKEEEDHYTSSSQNDL